MTEQWLQKIRDGANTPYSKDQAAKLTALVDKFNNKSQSHGLKEPDWESWKEKIHTPGVVDKIKAKYLAFMETNYDVTDAVGRIDSSTEKLNALDLGVKYNHAIWSVPY